MKSSIHSIELLNSAILEAETKQSEQWEALTSTYQQTLQHFKPINLLKNGFQEMGTIGDSILSNTVGLATGSLTKTILFGATTQPIKKVLGALLQYQITAAISKHPETVHALTKGLLSFFKKKEPNPSLSVLVAHQNNNPTPQQNES